MIEKVRVTAMTGRSPIFEIELDWSAA
jgi:hypothetical protein